MSEGETTLFWSRSKTMKKMHQQVRGRWLDSVTNGSTRAMSRALYGGREFLQIRCADARNRGDRHRWCTRSTAAAKQLANSCSVTTMLRDAARSPPPDIANESDGAR